MSDNLFDTVDGFSYNGAQTVPEGTKQEPSHLCNRDISRVIYLTPS